MSVQMSDAAKAARAAYNREWKKKNPEKVKAYKKKYRRNHPEVVRACLRRWKQKNPDKVALYNVHYWEKKALEMQERA